MRLPLLVRDRSTNEPSSLSAVPSFEYSPLEGNHIRLVYLQPRRAKQRAEVIECALVHKAFGYPEYKALSYAWGDGNTKRTILLNGAKFEVNETLAAALVNIRGLESAVEKSQPLWIDAICINQAESAQEERARQVRLMPQIYNRAQMVLVWLGTRVIFKCHCDRENDIRSQKRPKHSNPRLPVVDYEFREIQLLCKRAYWNRLWIIQEIGKAVENGLRIHYDFTTIEWARFIEILERPSSSFAKSIPVQLDLQRKFRFSGGGHTFSNLLETNQKALCKNPRDKIYGFIGLAVDISSSRFPVDYSKSLFGVYTDTMFFLNRDQTNAGRSQHDILAISRLLDRMVGGHLGLETEGLATDFHAGIINVNPSTGSFRVPGWLVGRIQETGPLYSDLVYYGDKLEAWETLIGNSTDFQLGSTVSEQSERFLNLLRRFDEVSQRTVFAFDTSITWEEAQQESIKDFERDHGSHVGSTGPESLDSYRHGPRLFLTQPRLDDGAPSWMGLGPLGTQAGDFICQFSGIERAIVIRQSPSSSSSPVAGQTLYTYQILGCAGLARDTNTARGVNGDELLPHQLFAAGWPGPPIKEAHLNTYMDIRTAWEISKFC